MKKNIKNKILSVICVIAVLFATNAFGVSATSIKNSNSTYVFVGNSMEEFKGEIYVKDNGENNAYYVDENITWEDSDSKYGLQEGDIIGICENTSNSDNEISYSVHGVKNTITGQNSCSNNSEIATLSTKSSDNITAQHIGHREYQKYSGTSNLTGKQRVHAETLASISYTQKGCKITECIDSYSVAQYEWLGSVRLSSGKVWNKNYTFWSYANTKWADTSEVKGIHARTYWGTEK